MSAVEIRSDAAGAGAAVVLARATELLLEGSATIGDELLPDGRLDSPAGPLVAHDVASGASALVAKLLLDVETVLNISRAETLHRLGLWVAEQEARR